MTKITEPELKSTLQRVLKRALQYFVDLTNQSLKPSEQEIDSFDYSESPYPVSYSYLKFIEFIFVKFRPTKVEIKITNQEPRYGNDWIISKIQFDNEQGEIGSLTLRQEGYGYPRIDLRIEPKVEKPEIERRLDTTLYVSASSVDRYDNPQNWELICEAHSRVPGVINDGKIMDFYLFKGSHWAEYTDLVQAGHWNTADLPGELCTCIDNGEYAPIKDEWYMKAQGGGYNDISGRGAIETLHRPRNFLEQASPDKFVNFFVDGSSQCRALELATEFYSDPVGFIKCYDGIVNHRIPERDILTSIPSHKKRAHTPTASLDD